MILSSLLLVLELIPKSGYCRLYFIVCQQFGRVLIMVKSHALQECA